MKPNEPGKTPDGYVKMPIPFVGIYQSLLGGDIDNEIDTIQEWYKEQGLPCDQIRIHYDDIYKSIALYTAELLGIEGAIYAGTVCPKYYNYEDDQPYLFVPEKFYVEHCGEIGEHSRVEILEFLNDELCCEVDEWYLEEYGEYVAQAVYAQWANGTNNGLEIINNSLEVEDLEILE